MKIIIVRRSLKRFLVEINTNQLVKEVAVLVARRKNPEAVAAIMAKGRIEREITDSDLKNVTADVILTENGA